MIRAEACVVPECDGQGCIDKGWPNDGPLHFPSQEEALRYLVGDETGCGWTQLPDGSLLCRSCSEDADCTATGHQFIPWRPHHRDPLMEWRFCRHCGGAREERRTIRA